MSQAAALTSLVAGVVGFERADWLLDAVDVHPTLRVADPGGAGWVPRAVLAQALAVLLFDDLLERVPSGAGYVAERRERGDRVFLDHGAVRTVDGVTCGALPPGEAGVTRVLAALGYRHRYTYDLARLRMTGRSWCHRDLPEAIAQYFVSELHADAFSPGFQEAAARVFATSEDPLDPAASARLAALASSGGLALGDAAALLPVIVSCFRRQHAAPSVADYRCLLGESPEGAWIATEGTVCNHMTDRVADVSAVAAAERAAGRPIKDTVEVSGSGRIRQTAHRAGDVTRMFAPGRDGIADRSVALTVPGSFFEFITRDPLPDGSGLDLAFDAANAQQIFAMTRVPGAAVAAPRPSGTPDPHQN